MHGKRQHACSHNQYTRPWGMRTSSCWRAPVTYTSPIHAPLVFPYWAVTTTFLFLNFRKLNSRFRIELLIQPCSISSGPWDIDWNSMHSGCSKFQFTVFHPEMREYKSTARPVWSPPLRRRVPGRLRGATASQPSVWKS